MAITSGGNRIEAPSETLTQSGATVGYWYGGEDAIAQAVASEREACAFACLSIDDACPDCAAHNDHEQCTVPGKEEYAAAIRARGKQENAAE